MTTHHKILWSVFAALCPALIVTGCAASALTNRETDACNINASWISEDKPATSLGRTAAALENALPADASGRIAEQVGLIVAAEASDNEEEARKASSELSIACEGAGWEPPEG
jgi:hypothetical protein